MMKNILLAGVFAIAATAAQADNIQLASLASVDGRIMVNKGKGFVSAKPGMTLTEGDRIIALDGSRAAVVYPDGCVTQLTENSLLAMEKGGGCGKAPVKTGGSQPPLRYAQAIGGPLNDGRPAGPAGFSPPPPPPGLALVLIGGGALGAAILFNSKARENARPLSPF